MEIWKVGVRSLVLELTSLRASCERTGPLVISSSSAFHFKGVEAGIDGQDEAADSWREAGLDVILSM